MCRQLMFDLNLGQTTQSRTFSGNNGSNHLTCVQAVQHYLFCIVCVVASSADITRLVSLSQEQARPANSIAIQTLSREHIYYLRSGQVLCLKGL